MGEADELQRGGCGAERVRVGAPRGEHLGLRAEQAAAQREADVQRPAGGLARAVPIRPSATARQGAAGARQARFDGDGESPRPRAGTRCYRLSTASLSAGHGLAVSEKWALARFFCFLDT